MNSPKEVIRNMENAGIVKAGISSGRPSRLIVLSVLAGVYIAIGGTLSVVAGFGFPELTAGNPSLQRLLSGATFPIGLILVVLVGAELFTGNNAVLMPGALNGKISPAAVVRNWTFVYFGNFAGALLFTWLFVYLCGVTASDPYNAAIRNIALAKVSMPWHVVLLKGIGANWFVCLAVWLAAAGKTMAAKMAGCWLPVMAFVALGYEHSIANMFFIPAGMMEGAEVSVGRFVFDNLIPATIGNIIGGALMVGTAYWFVYGRKEA